MSGFIIFDVHYKNKTDVNACKLPCSSEFQQLKLMLCGKYRIYEVDKLKIYFKRQIMQYEPFEKLRDIFKGTKVKIDIYTDDKDMDKDMSISTIKDSPDHTPQKQTGCSSPKVFHCKCKNYAYYVCDHCQEFICDRCLKKKHITHGSKVIKLKEYNKFVKEVLRNTAKELDEKITNDEAYHFISAWNYDLSTEIKNFGETFDNMKRFLEDIKQIEIDFIIKLCDARKYKDIKVEIDKVIKDYGKMDLTQQPDKIMQQKKMLLDESKDILSKFGELKSIIITYTNILRDFQGLNSTLMHEVQKKFDFVKKNFMVSPMGDMATNLDGMLNFADGDLKGEKINIPKSPNSPNSPNSPSSPKSPTHFNTEKYNVSVESPELEIEEGVNKSKEDQKENEKKEEVKEKEKDKKELNNSLDVSQNKKGDASISMTEANFYGSHVMKSQPDLGKSEPPNLADDSRPNMNQNLTKSFLTPADLRASRSQNKLINNRSLNPNASSNGSAIFKDKCLYKLKNLKKIFIFSSTTQSFKEREFGDPDNFRANVGSDNEVIQLNIKNRLYLIAGKKHNKFYYYDPISNKMNFVSNTLFQHYYGCLVYCEKNNSMYLLGGCGQSKCEIFNFDNNNKNAWRRIANLTEERQEFAAMYLKKYIYVFFGFSAAKGDNLSSIERMDTESNSRFEVIYINDQISLSGLG
ncbi:MAG: B-box zinc finger protein, partial [archaeon]|nr:B-box zinc finger protein [archaeon]